MAHIATWHFAFVLALFCLLGVTSADYCPSYSSTYCYYGCCDYSTRCCSYDEYYDSLYSSTSTAIQAWVIGVIVGGSIFGLIVIVSIIVCIVMCVKSSTTSRGSVGHTMQPTVAVVSSGTTATTTGQWAQPAPQQGYGPQQGYAPQQGYYGPQPGGPVPPAYTYTNPAYPPNQAAGGSNPGAVADPFAANAGVK